MVTRSEKESPGVTGGSGGAFFTHPLTDLGTQNHRARLRNIFLPSKQTTQIRQQQPLTSSAATGQSRLVFTPLRRPKARPPAASHNRTCSSGLFALLQFLRLLRPLKTSDGSTRCPRRHVDHVVTWTHDTVVTCVVGSRRGMGVCKGAAHDESGDLFEV